MSLFGEPGKGIHEKRIYGFAFWDIFLTIIAAMALTHFNDNFIANLLILLIIGEGLHFLFNVDTTLKLKIESILNKN